MKKTELLAALRSFAEGDSTVHPILDHKGDFEFKDHRWHAKNLLETGYNGGENRVDSLFGLQGIDGAPAITRPLAEHLPHLPHFGMQLTPRFDLAGKLKGTHGYSLEVTDPGRLAEGLRAEEAPNPDFPSAAQQLGHLLGTVEAMNDRAGKGILGEWGVPAETYGDIATANESENSAQISVSLTRMDDIKAGIKNGLMTQNVQEGALKHTQDHDELREKVQALDPDDWVWQNKFVISTPQDTDDWHDFLDSIGAINGSIDTSSDADEAAAYLEQGGASEEQAKEWAEEQLANSKASHPQNAGEVNDWLENEHGHPADDVDSTIEGVNILQAADVDPDVVQEWIRNQLNFSTSQGGAVNDGEYDSRAFKPKESVKYLRAEVIDALENDNTGLNFDQKTDMRHALAHVAKYPTAADYHAEQKARALALGVQGVVQTEAEAEDWATRMTALNDTPRRTLMENPPPAPDPLPENMADMPIMELLTHPATRHGIFGALDNYVNSAGFEGAQDWDDRDAENAVKLQSNWDSLPEKERDQRYRDTARYVDMTEKAPAMILSDDAKKAVKWVGAGSYQYTRYNTIPRNDSSTRTQREDQMGIGRVNYAAHGWDAPLPPLVRPLSSDGSTLLSYSNPSFPLDDLHNSEAADFRTQGYGDTRFAFDYPSDYDVSHAVSDTYMDARYCDQEGYGAVLANAPAFAEVQANYKTLASPTMGGHHGPSGDLPTFVELHPKDLPTSSLRGVHLTGLFVAGARSGGAEFVGVKDEHDKLIDSVLKKSDANIVITPDDPRFWPGDYIHRSLNPLAPTLMRDAQGKLTRNLVTNYDQYNADLMRDWTAGNPWKEQDARDLIERAQAHLDETYKKHGEGRVKLYIPKWAR
jgi:hypothetical protein